MTHPDSTDNGKMSEGLRALIDLRRTPHPDIPISTIVEEMYTPTQARAPGLFFSGDNLAAMQHLRNTHAGRIMCIYCDPPFDQGGVRAMRIQLRENAAIRSAAYVDQWGRGEASYLQMMRDRLLLMRELLHEEGTLYLHCDSQSCAVLRLLCDEIFGVNRFMNHLIWAYKTGGISRQRGFARKHDDILVYSKGAHPVFHPEPQKSFVPTLPEPHTPSGKRLSVQRETTCSLCGADGPGQKFRMVNMRDVWDDIPTLFRNAREAEGYPTQKPLALLERIICASSNPGDLVADFFSGSGGLAEAAHQCGRLWIAADAGRLARHASRRRWLQAGMPFITTRLENNALTANNDNTHANVKSDSKKRTNNSGHDKQKNGNNTVKEDDIVNAAIVQTTGTVTFRIQKVTDAWHVHLEQFAVSHAGLPEADVCALHESPSPTLLDLWAIDPNWNDKTPFTHASHAMRERKGAMDIEREMTISHAPQKTLGVFLVDCLGFTTTLSLPLREGQKTLSFPA